MKMRSFKHSFINLSCIIYLVLVHITVYRTVRGNTLDLSLTDTSYEVKSEDYSNPGVIGSPYIKIISYHNVYKRNVALNSTLSNKNESMAINETVSQQLNSTEEVKNITSNIKEEIHSNSSLYDSNSGENSEISLDGINNTSSVPKFDHHKYYRSFSKNGMEDVVQYWVDLDRLPEEHVISDDSLSSAHRRALTVPLKFDFPFYGHILQNVTIATGGFLFTGSFLHKWLAATQYIAPLMANFDTSVSPNASVKYADNGTSLTVQWDKVVLQDNPAVGSFTFQVTIKKSGHIIFAYKDIPIYVTLIEDWKHPVKVGLSDAYIVEKTIFYVRKKTIYEYHKINIMKEMQISNWTAIVFEPLPLCVSFDTCETCLKAETSFKCEWCPSVGRCSDGMDRHRQDWLEKRCSINAVSNFSVCSSLSHPTSSSVHEGENVPAGAASLDSGVTEGAEAGHSNVLVGFMMALVVVVFLIGWVTYAYLYPHTASGQLLIKYRPSAWSWRLGEARYTAATMHSIHI